MESVQSFPPPSEGNSMFSGKNMVIVILVALLALSFLGINLLTISGNVIQTLVAIFGPLITQILSILGYTAGSVIEKTADVVSDTAKTGIDIAEGTLQSVGGLLKTGSIAGINEKSRMSLDNALSTKDAVKAPSAPVATGAENPIQNPISASKNQWCLVGEYKQKRGCIELGEDDKCLSGQTFPSKTLCLNPTLTPNVPPTTR